MIARRQYNYLQVLLPVAELFGQAFNGSCLGECAIVQHINTCTSPVTDTGKI